MPNQPDMNTNKFTHIRLNASIKIRVNVASGADINSRRVGSPIRMNYKNQKHCHDTQQFHIALSGFDYFLIYFHITPVITPANLEIILRFYNNGTFKYLNLTS